LRAIFLGRKSFVGFTQTNTIKNQQLAKIKPGVLSPYEIPKNTTNDAIERLNLLYSKNFSILFDIQVIMSNWKKLDI
jgi:lipopolysaccharide/colanic/teichoic acid biosynthesis glycosyltransferase